ncbi:MAG: glycoside hydrolase family 95 protein [Verrucomicrobia bacterium]|nr:glycoside hydrolase family 95 protein [Verrucomicrobiota bacterium]
MGKRICVSILMAFAMLSTISAVGAPKYPSTQTKLPGNPGRYVFEKHAPAIEKPTTLWFLYPAQSWLEALPIGNGAFGAMTFGGLTKDVVQFNHDTLWTPPDLSPDIINNRYPDKSGVINRVRKLIFQQKAHEAHEVVREELLHRYDVGSYQPFGELLFDYDFGVEPKKGSIKEYQRRLDMRTGISFTSFTIGDTRYERQVFVSNKRDVIGIRMAATGPGTFSANMTFSRPAYFDHQKIAIESCAPNQIAMSGVAHGKKITPYSTRYEAVAQASVSSGSVTSQDGALHVKDSRDMTVWLSGVTSYNSADPFKPLDTDLRGGCRKLVTASNKAGWEQTQVDAVKAHQAIFERVDLRLGEAQPNDVPTNERVMRSKDLPEGEHDPYLTTQLFHMGRYLLICSSRPGSLWVNLRGIWNSELRPTWNSDYHHDINIEMSYWSAEVTNMSECHVPLFDSLRLLRRRGQRVASEMFGNRGVFVPLCHGGYLTAYPPTPPQSMWAMGGAWDATHVMEHYRFGGDKEYLKNEGYEIIKDHTLFCLDWLVTDPRTGKLVGGPDYSPETAFARTAEDKQNRRWGHEDMGCAMDQQIIWQLFTDFLQASKILGYSDELTREVEDKRSRLAETRVGADGTIMEWSEDVISSEPDHRHISHLWAYFPGNQFHINNAPDMLEAAKKTLAIRTDSERGGKRVTWSNIYYVYYFARFAMPEKALDWINNLNRIRGFNRNLMGSQGQVQDCNYAYPGAVAEMLLQSHTGEIVLLPALPKAWTEGEVSGLVTRGGFEVSIRWKDGKLTGGSILSKRGEPCVVRYKDKRVKMNLKKGELRVFPSQGRTQARERNNT